MYCPISILVARNLSPGETMSLCGNDISATLLVWLVALTRKPCQKWSHGASVDYGVDMLNLVVFRVRLDTIIRVRLRLWSR